MRRFSVWIGLGCLIPLLALAATPRANRLADHPSPYLSMHGQDPVHWQTWGPAAWDAARRENKLLFVSSGYYACHWCHVMQRESYRNPEIARLLNENFIPVKVDRELQPALDARLIAFVERLQGQAGWPLNVFITPEGYPLVGTVYLPPDRFGELLRELARQWQESGEEMAALARAAGQSMAPGPLALPAAPPPDLGKRYAHGLRKQTWELADEMAGGFGEQSKFPSVPQLRVLLAEQVRAPDERLRHFLQLTLERMASQGLRDHLGGGFFRYTVDPLWQIPHFEKMLYDNAQLASLYLQAATVLDTPAHVTVARETLDFVLRELAVDGGGYAASLSAIDAAGVEGGYYLWRPEELARLLTPDELAVVRRHWGLEGAPELEAGFHLRVVSPLAEVARELKMPLATARQRLASARRKLLAARAQRNLPRDDKVITAWNGLLLSALARASRLPDSQAYREAGQRLHDFLLARLWQDGRLVRARAGGRIVGEAGIEDYAYAVDGLRDWYATTGAEDAGKRIRPLLERAWTDFYGPDGWRLSRESWLKFGAGEPVLSDDVMPSPSARLLAVTLSLEKGGERAALARRLLAAGQDIVEEAPFWYATHIDTVRRFLP
ncbi:MAG TPA: thioredoxin domain-containing protein [Gammaproteobacteria bacterium]|nr:thioredoxin domain-containing protein [Gammaproteobacteria bacterium]